jgi:hypothetical protein
VIYASAGGEFSWELHSVVQTYARVSLVTAYKYITGRSDKGRSKIYTPTNFRYVLNTLEDRPLIVDSGMFTIQGQVFPPSGAGTAPHTYKTSDWIRWYIDRYVALLDGFKGLVVECDCHMLTPTWERDLDYARGVLKSAFGDRLIYVWHPHTGERLGDLTRGVRRVAISEPAMKTASTRPADAIRAAVKAAKVRPDQHVHLLGTTNFAFAELPDNFSCDSSTWSMIVRVGRSFPRTRFPVEWYRRKKLMAPAGVLEEVDAKFAQCCDAARLTPLNTARASKPEYLRALAAALVASNRLLDSLSKHYTHPPSGVVLGANPSWHTETARTLSSKATAPGKTSRPKRRNALA